MARKSTRRAAAFSEGRERGGAHPRRGTSRLAAAGRTADTRRRGRRALSNATISFGLVTIPVELHSATRSLAPAFHLVHSVCGNRIQQQTYCPVCERVVERSELVRGFELERDQHVVFTPEELERLEGEASRAIELVEFVPLAAVDPIYFETSYYLGPGDGSEKAYRLLVEAMEGTGRAGVATFLMRGKENLVAIRAVEGSLVLHTLFFADEVRERPTAARGGGPVRESEVQLARRLIDELARDTFAPERYEDAYRQRVLDAARAKAKGRTVAVPAAAPKRAPVVSIMDALKASLEGRRRAAPAARVRSSRSGAARKAS